MAFQQQNRNDVPVATAIPLVDATRAGTGAKTGLARLSTTKQALQERKTLLIMFQSLANQSIKLDTQRRPSMKRL